MHKTGFFSIRNTGFEAAEIERQYDIGQQFFALDPEVKSDKKYQVDFANGNYFGYKPVSTPH